MICGKLHTDPERVAFMCVLKEGHKGVCSPSRPITTWAELQWRLTHCSDCQCEYVYPRPGCVCVCHDEYE